MHVQLIIPKTKLSGLKICPKGPERTESIVPGSKSTKMALGTYFPPRTQILVSKFLFGKKRKKEKMVTEISHYSNILS